MTFQTTSIHMARKAHRCETCRDLIEPGTTYIKTAGVWEGDFYTAKQHEDCRKLWDALWPDWGDPNDGMPYDLTEMFCEYGEVQATREALEEHRATCPGSVARIEARLSEWLREGGA